MARKGQDVTEAELAVLLDDGDDNRTSLSGRGSRFGPLFVGRTVSGRLFFGGACGVGSE